MNFPAIAKQTYENLKNQQVFLSISQFVIEHLKKIASSSERARFVHNVVDDYNQSVFAHPLVLSLSPCKAGCAGCCHTQVSITEDEADLLVSRIEAGVKIDYALLQKQMRAGNDSELFNKMTYQERKCVFLGSANTCQVYDDRPSVCRTNAVLGDTSQCSTENGVNSNNELRLVKTAQADMAIMGSFLNSKESGTIPHMVGKLLFKKGLNSTAKQVRPNKKPFSNDCDL